MKKTLLFAALIPSLVFASSVQSMEAINGNFGRYRILCKDGKEARLTIDNEIICVSMINIVHGVCKSDFDWSLKAAAEYICDRSNPLHSPHKTPPPPPPKTPASPKKTSAEAAKVLKPVPLKLNELTSQR